jgi:hypothetical protein
LPQRIQQRKHRRPPMAAGRSCAQPRNDRDGREHGSQDRKTEAEAETADRDKLADAALT